MILALISLINLFIHGVFQLGLVFAVFIMLASILLFLSLSQKFARAKFLLAVSLAFLIYFSLARGFDKHLFRLSDLDIQKITARQGYFFESFGRVYANRFGIFYLKNLDLTLIKFNKNLFSHLDFNLFFNVRNPISIFFIPLFLFGSLSLFRNVNKVIIIYLLIIFITGGFLSPIEKYGYLLYLPVVNVLIYLGLESLKKLIKNVSI